MNNRIRRIEKHVGKNVDFQSIEVVIPQENEEVKLIVALSTSFSTYKA